MITWLKPAIAPKTGRTILGVFGNDPFPKTATWNEPNGEWCTASCQIGMYQGVLNDTHFENEYEPENQLVKWADVFGPAV